MIGASVGNYRVVERIGDGGMGTVYRAVDQMLDREVALKVMRPELSRQAALSERFRQEAIALARLNHPNIAAVYGLEKNGDDLVMVMEYVRGETLESIVQRSGRLAWARAFELCREALAALEHAHDKGVVHRDIKPANIMLARDGTVKVMDFGIARIMGRSRQTRVGAAVGTPMYMSPEQLKGEEVDGRSDLYSMGAVVFELVTGRMAFEADSDYELMMKQLNDPPPPVRSILPDVPLIVDSVLQRALAKRREDRYRDAREMRDVLTQALSHQAAAPAPHRPAPATRLAAEPSGPPPASEIGVTADMPTASSSRVAETRLAPEPAGREIEPRVLVDAAPATRLAVPSAPAGGTDLTRWLTDWRAWSAVAASLFVVAVFARSGREERVEPADHDSAVVVADTPRAPVPGSLGDTAGRATVPPPPVTSAPANSMEGLRPLTPGPAETPRATQPNVPARREPRPAETEPRQTEATAPQVRQPDPPPPPPERTEPRPAGSDAPPERGEDAEAARREIAGEVAGFARAVSAGEEGRVGSVLRAGEELEREWLGLMKERRLLMDVSGAPDIDLSGARATARFSAILNVRSAFGANRRRTAQFVAEVARSGGSWRVTSVRPVGAISLK
ncbi:MAG: protein kinase [Gemmatimonadaceae bacterium]|nr:protein kinase [Gemmatimonadaceae bacterium]